MKRLTAAAAAVMVMLSWPAGVWSGQMETMGASSRGTAMGGAMVSIANGWDAVHYNPSALALSPKTTSVQVSYISGRLMMNKDDMLNDGLLMKFGINSRFLRNRLGVGMIVGLSTTQSAGLSLDVFSLLGGGGPPNWTWQRYQDQMPVLLELGIGFRIADWLAVGISANQKDSLVSTSFYALSIDPFLESFLGLSTGMIPSNIETMNFSAGADPTDDFATGFNISFRPWEYVSFGYVYKPEAWSRYKVRVKLVGGEASLLPQHQYIVIDMKIPGQVETAIWGVAGHIPIPWNDGTLTLAYSREMQNWDGFYPRSTTYQWEATDIFSGEWFSEKQTKDPGLEDVVFDRWGFEYVGDASPFMFGPLAKLSNPRFAVRGGYYHWDSPQPDIRYGWQLAMVDANADVYSFGLGFGFDRPSTQKSLENPLYVRRVEIDLHVQVTNLEDRQYRIREDEWGYKPLERYMMDTKGNITNIGIQITWIN